jgi:hypothetical protein
LLGLTWAGLAPAERASLLAPSFIRSPRSDDAKYVFMRKMDASSELMMYS